MDRLDSTELQLYVLRHAHAGNPAHWTGNDADRPLSAKGRAQAARLGRFLAARGIVPDTIVSSPRLRARQTADLVTDALGVGVTTDERLGGPFDLDALGALIDGVGGTSLMIVGHDPDLSELAATLVGAADLPLRKGAVARIDLALPVAPACGILRWLLPPELLESAES
jgi:phosphohistidine phosphatase